MGGQGSGGAGEWGGRGVGGQVLNSPSLYTPGPQLKEQQNHPLSPELLVVLKR